MHDMPSATSAYRWRRWQRAWQVRRHRLLRLFWLGLLLAGGMLLHLHLANQTVYLWNQIQTLREENWRLWWEIQALYARKAEREARILAARHARERLSEPDRPVAKGPSWRWPSPQEVLFLPPATSGERLPPIPALPGPVPPAVQMPDAYRRSLWHVLRSRWFRFLHRLGGDSASMEAQP